MALKDPKTCRIFFSSPFGGMEGEREELTRKYFPQLHHLCNSKGIQFVAVDMRWGITAEASSNAQVINICLRELDRSDLFVGFFGQRYGWHGRNDDLLQRTFDEALGRYPFLEQWRDKSVTELEFLHGHLNAPGELPAVICFRNKAYDDKRRAEGLEKGSKSLVYKYSAEEGSTPLMDDLKARVKATEHKTLGVNMAYTTPEEGAKFMFDAVWKHLTEVTLKGLSGQQLSRRENELLQHTAFVKNRSGLYVGGDNYLSALNASLNTGKPALVKGIKGSGKSALLSTWIKQLQENHENLILAYHFVGFADGSTGVPNILRRLHEECEHHVGNGSGSDNPKDKFDGTDLMEIIQHWTRTLKQTLQKIAGDGRKTLLVIDGLNMVDSPGKVGKHLFWLPDSLPENVHLVVSSVSSDEKTNTELVDKRNFSVIELLPLVPEDQATFCEKSLMRSGKELSPEQLRRVVDAELTHNPLFLTIVMEELCVFGYFRNLDQKIDSLINSDSVDALFLQYLERLEADYNVKEYSGNLVEQVMCCLALSHNGLTENELTEMFSIPGYIWSPLYFAMNKYLVDRSGLLGFGYSELKAAVEKKYLQSAETKKKYCKDMISFFRKQMKSLLNITSPKDSRNLRPCFELPWLYMKTGDKRGLATVLSELLVFETLFSDDLYQLLELWKQTGLGGKAIAKKCIHSFNTLLANDYCEKLENWLDQESSVRMKLLKLLENVRQMLSLAQMIDGEEMILIRSKEMLENLDGKMNESTRIVEINSLNYSLACLYCDTGRFEEAEAFHNEVLSYRESCVHSGHTPSLQELRNLAVSHHGIAATHLSRGNWDEAEKMFHKSMEYHKQVPQDMAEKTADCYVNLGNVYMNGRADFTKALEYYNDAFKLYEEAFFGQLPLTMGNLLTNMALCHRKMDQLDEAEYFYKRSLEIKVNAVGEDHPSTALAYLNLSTLEAIRQNYPKAEEYCRNALRIYEVNEFPSRLKEVVMARENLALNLAVYQGRQEESLQFYWPAFEVLVEKKEMNSCLPRLHAEIARYCLQEGRYDDGRKITMAMLDSSVACDRNYIHLHFLDSQLPEDQRPKHPREYSLEHALTIWPFSKGLVEYSAQNHMIPRGDEDGFLQMLENYHKATDGREGDEFFKQAAGWCAACEKKDLMMSVFHTGLKLIPKSKILLCNVILTMREENQVVEAVPFAQRLYDSSMDECRFQMFATETVSIAGRFDLARKFLLEIKDRWSSEDGIPEKVENLLKVISEVEAQAQKSSEET